MSATQTGSSALIEGLDLRLEEVPSDEYSRSLAQGFFGIAAAEAAQEELHDEIAELEPASKGSIRVVETDDR